MIGHTQRTHILTMRIKIPLYFATSALGLSMQLVVSMTAQERFQNPTKHIAYTTTQADDLAPRQAMAICGTCLAWVIALACEVGSVHAWK